VKIYSVEQIDHLIKNDLFHENTQIICELFVNNCKIKQCINCQRYEHINKIYRYEKRCSICFKSHNDFACKMSINKKKCVNYENTYLIWFFQCKIKMTKKNRIFDIWRTKSIYTQQIWKTHNERFLTSLTFWFKKRSFVTRLRHRRRHSVSR
jgi:hypothetical protein